MIHSNIRRSTSDDIRAIHAWLLEEKKNGVEGNFLCNWSVIERAHRERGLLVFVDHESSSPLAFQLGGLLEPGILQVRHSHRGRGIGRRLIERCVAIAYRRCEPLLLIQCTPSTSIPFWERMGFTLFGTQNYAYRILGKHHKLPKRCDAISVVLRFYPEKRKWLSATEPYLSASPSAVRSQDGLISLAERVSFHEEAHGARDTVVEVIIADETIYCDKAKYNEAPRLGIRRCRNGYFVDRLDPQGRFS